MPRSHALQKRQVGSGWQARDRSALLPCQHQLAEGLGDRAWVTRSEQGHSTEAGWPWRGDVSSLLLCSLCPVGEGREASEGCLSSRKIPQGPGSGESVAVLATDAALPVWPSSGAPPQTDAPGLMGWPKSPETDSFPPQVLPEASY